MILRKTFTALNWSLAAKFQKPDLTGTAQELPSSTGKQQTQRLACEPAQSRCSTHMHTGNTACLTPAEMQDMPHVAPCQLRFKRENTKASGYSTAQGYHVPMCHGGFLHSPEGTT